MERILVTGGLGYIGYDVIKNIALCNEDFEIIIYDNLSRRNLGVFFQKEFFSNHIKFIQGDILDDRSLELACKDVDTIIHLAGKVGNPYNDNDLAMFDYVNNWGTANVVNAANECGVSKFIYLSSLSVYGFRNEKAIDPHAPSPSTEYGMSKYNGEKQLINLSDKCKVIVLRSGNVFGFNPSLRLDTVINSFVFKSRFGDKLIINGNGKQHRSFIHVERLARQILFSILSPTIESGTYNISDFNLDIISLVKIIKEINPSTEYTHVSSGFDIKNQLIETSSMGNIKTLNRENFEKEILDFYNSFSI